MIKRVLIPLDGSELAEEVIPHLLRFVLPEQTELLFMTALSPVIPSLGDFEQPSLEQVLALAGEQVKSSIERVTEQLNQLGFRTTQKFLLGAPADMILRLAEEEHADLIAMSTHGRTGVGRALLGSVSDKVVRHARSPVFLVPAGTEQKISPAPQTLLVPLDGSQFAETAIPIAQEMARLTKASIHLLRAIKPANLHERELMFSDEESVGAVQKSLAQIATTYLEKIHLRLQLAGVPTSYQIVFSEPAIAIAQVASTENTDLIVMSTHGRTGVERMLYGSVASQVIHDATCPLLLLHGQETVQVTEAVGTLIPVGASAT